MCAFSYLRRIELMNWILSCCVVKQIKQEFNIKFNRIFMSNMINVIKDSISMIISDDKYFVF